MIDSSNVSFLPGCEHGEDAPKTSDQVFKPSQTAIEKADKLNTGLRERIIKDSGKAMLHAALQSSLNNDVLVGDMHADMQPKYE